MDSIIQLLRSSDQSSTPIDDVRAQILALARRLCQRLETPYEWMKRYVLEQPALNCCLDIADQVQLFKQLGKKDSATKTALELAHATNTEPALLRRILRHLAANGVVGELEEGGEVYYQASELSETLASPQGSSGLHNVAQLYTPLFSVVPEYLRSTGYQVPQDVRKGPFQGAIAKHGELKSLVYELVDTSMPSKVRGFSWSAA
ncbi:MAG: hypothetical protein Q9191_002170 [Dirinaria sp. TL-2023a]